MSGARFTAPDGRHLHYVSDGAGPPVLCLAGLTRNHRDFGAVASHLSDRHRVIRLDSRGRGGSDWAEDPIQEYQVAVEAGDAAALLEHLALGPTAILGTSRGGILGMALAATRPELLAGLILNDVGAVIDAAGLSRIGDYLGRSPAVDDFGSMARVLDEENGAAFPGLTHADWLRVAREMFNDEDGRPVLSYDARLREAFFATGDPAAGAVDLWPLFSATYATPVLLLRGAHSDILSASVAEEMAREHPRLTHVEVADRGHGPFLTEPEAVEAIDRFLAEVFA
ncbi:MAG: alpha/beta hydrolase [Pseudomonadota bacterium]